MPGHAIRRQIIAGVPAQRVVRAGMDAGRTRAAEGNGRRLIFCTRNRTDPISGFAKNGDAPAILNLSFLLSICVLLPLFFTPFIVRWHVQIQLLCQISQYS